MKNLTHYRPEVDGLRGLNVLCILLYHTNVPIFKSAVSGAFVTLDIFFVISGFLITQSILRRKAGFSFKRFYIRRIKRLYPALITTITASIFLGVFIFPPGRVENLAKSALASLFSVSNFYFGLNTDYFSYEAMSEVFLHMWSLSMEEQFYLLYPAFLLLFLKKTPGPVKALSIFFIVSAISVALGEYFATERAKFVYYLLPFRAHEFLAGALICFLPSINRSLYRELLTALGALFIFYAIFGLNNRDPYPGFNSILPTLGTFLLIYCGDKGRVSALLFGWSPLKIMGLSCYSIYLFHWPLFVYYRYLSLDSNQPGAYLVLCLASILVGLLFYSKVEKKIIALAPNSEAESKFLRYGLLSFLAVLAICLFLYKTDGLPDRYPKPISKTRGSIIIERSLYWNEVDQFFSKSPEVLFIGNSHAVDLIYMFQENEFAKAFDHIDTTFRCHHFVYPIRYWHRKYCDGILDKILDYTGRAQIKRIYLHDYWWVYRGKRLEQFLIKLAKNAPSKIYLFGPKMAYRHSIIDLFQIADFRNMSFNAILLEDQMSERIEINRQAKGLINSLKQKGLNIDFVDLLKLQCGNAYDSCKAFSKDGDLYYFDDSHFNRLGARFLGKLLLEHRPDLFKF